MKKKNDKTAHRLAYAAPTCTLKMKPTQIQGLINGYKPCDTYTPCIQYLQTQFQYNQDRDAENYQINILLPQAL